MQQCSTQQLVHFLFYYLFIFFNSIFFFFLLNLEISLPGFLSLSYEDQIRQERQISQGGAGVLYEGTLLDPQLIQKYNCHKVAIKMIPRSFSSFFFFSIALLMSPS